MSSILYDGKLGGLSGADAKCQGLAAAASLPGTYKAWLSDSTSPPISRFVPSSGPYRLVNGTTIAANFADLTDGTLLARINVTETGGGVGATNVVWSHTTADGIPGSDGSAHCANWSTSAAGGPNADVGRATDTDFHWTAVGSAPCTYTNHLYCFQQR